MRVAVFLLASAVYAAAADPEVIAPVSREDVREICRVVLQTTSQPVRTIGPVVSDYYVPGSVVAYYDEQVPGHADKPVFKRVKKYHRTDRVAVTTGDKYAVAGSAYYVQKIHGTWKILRGKGAWTQ